MWLKSQIISIYGVLVLFYAKILLRKYKNRIFSKLILEFGKAYIVLLWLWFRTLMFNIYARSWEKYAHDNLASRIFKMHSHVF